MLLLHICCGPCSLYPIKTLKERGIQIKGFFYNPNIHPYQEFKLRIEALEKVAIAEEIEILWDKTYDLDFFLEEVFFQREKPKRCERCYYLRLKKTAELASQLKASAFSTTLLYSPFQLHDLIKEIAEELSYKYKIPFHYEDWRIGYYEGKKRAIELNLYRQKYCGCIFSEKERFYKKT
ncbi:MAG: epoxyqueuosine reductase QueH [Caldimicrobium sp.]